MSVEPEDFVRLEGRVHELEVWKGEQITSNAVWLERRQSDRAEFERINRRFDRLDGHVTKLVWLILTAIIGGFLSFVLQGGLTVAS